MEKQPLKPSCKVKWHELVQMSRWKWNADMVLKIM